MSYKLSYSGETTDEAITMALEQQKNILKIPNLESDINTNANKITTLENNITSIKNDINILEKDIASLGDPNVLCNLLYPINSIYTAGNSSLNPNNLFPGTVWEQITLENSAENYINNYFGTTNLTISTFSDGSKWVPLVLQTNAGTNLFNSTTALQSNVTGKISNLYLLKNKTHDIFKDANGYYEFYLEYSTCKQRWKQTSNPTTTSNAVQGYIAVNCSTTANSWGGLSISSSSTSCYLDGTPGVTNWHYAVCNYTAYQDGIPSDSSSTYCYLYVRVPSLETRNILANDYNLLTYLGVAYWKRVS